MFDVNTADLELTRKILYLIMADALYLTTYNEQTKEYDHDKIYPFMVGRDSYDKISPKEIEELYPIVKEYGYYGEQVYMYLKFNDDYPTQPFRQEDLKKYNRAMIEVPKILGIDLAVDPIQTDDD